VEHSTYRFWGPEPPLHDAAAMCMYYPPTRSTQPSIPPQSSKIAA